MKRSLDAVRKPAPQSKSDDGCQARQLEFGLMEPKDSSSSSSETAEQRLNQQVRRALCQNCRVTHVPLMNDSSHIHELDSHTSKARDS